MVKRILGFAKSNPQLFESFFSLSALNGLNFLLPLISLPYLIRVVGPEKYGLYSFIYVIIQYVLLLSNYGFNFSATKFFAENRDNKSVILENFSAIIFLRVFIALVCIIVLLVAIFLNPTLNNDKLAFLFAIGIILGDILTPVWFFQGIEKMRYLTIINFFSKGLFTILIFIFIKKEDDYPLILLLNSFGFLCSAIISFIILYFKFNVYLIIPKKSSLSYHLVDGWHIFISTIGINFYRNANVFILGLQTSNLIVGYYAAAEKIVKAIQSLVTPVSESLYPYICKRFSVSEKQENIRVILLLGRYYFIVLLIISLLVFFFSYLLVLTVLGKDSIQSVTNLKIMSFVILFGGLNYFFGIIGLVNLNYKKQFSMFVLLSGLISILICAIFSPIYLDVAASFAMLFSEFLLFIMIFIYIIKLKNKNNYIINTKN